MLVDGIGRGQCTITRVAAVETVVGPQVGCEPRSGIARWGARDNAKSGDPVAGIALPPRFFSHRGGRIGGGNSECKVQPKSTEGSKGQEARPGKKMLPASRCVVS